MRLLLTNDDGLSSAALLALRKRLDGEHDVLVVAPDDERSGSSHAITVRRPIRVRRFDDRTFSCGGTPADCVNLVGLGLVGLKVDMVVSGPNLGPNLGTDIVYSGTAAASRQAALMGMPAVAASMYSPDPADFPFAADFIARNLELFREVLSPEPDHFLNINFPGGVRPGAQISVTHPSLRIYSDRLERFTLSDSESYCFITGELPHAASEDGSDWDAVRAGRISLSPILVHPLNHSVEERYERLRLWTGR